MNNMSKILIIVEGERRDADLMKRLIRTYGLDDRHEVYSYNTGIYALYNQMFRDKDPHSLDLLQVLKENEQDECKRDMLSERYSDILLVFDFDPQDTFYSEETIKSMSDYFIESSDMGKLYLNYPMVESFFHMKSIPDPDYESYTSGMDELKQGGYKRRVADETRDKDYKKFAKDRDECSIVINANIDKARQITGHNEPDSLPNGSDILDRQIAKLKCDEEVYVLSTCGFYIHDYNPNLLN